MQVTDAIADMLTRIRNANSAKHDSVKIPASNMKKAIAQILVDEGYIKGFTVEEDGKQGIMDVQLKYGPNKSQVITGIQGIVQHKVLVQGSVGIVAPVAEQIVAKVFLFAGRCLQETGRNDLVGIHIFQRKGHTGACYDIEFLFHLFSD